MALRELLASFSIDAGSAVSTLKSLDHKISGAGEKLAGLAEAFVGGELLSGMKEFITQQIELGSVLNDTSERLGIGTDDLQSFQFAAGLAGVSSESASQALGFLNKNMGEALDGNKEAVQTFKDLDVSLKDSGGNVRELGDVIPEIADAFEKMGSDQERTAKIMKIFGKSGAALIPLLKGGSKELVKMHQEFLALGGGMSKEFIEAADKTGDELDKMKFGFKSFKSAIAAEALPYVLRFAEKGQDLAKRLIKLSRETDLAKYAITGMGVAGAASAAKVVYEFSKLFGLLPAGNAGIIKTLASLGGIGLVIGLFVGAAIAVEDLWTSINGGEGLIAGLVTEIFGLERGLEFVAAMREAWDAVKQAIEPLGPVVEKVGTEVGKIALKWGPKLLATFVQIVTAVSEAIVKVSEFFGLLNSEDTGKGVGADMMAKRQAEIAARAMVHVEAAGGRAPAPGAPAVPVPVTLPAPGGVAGAPTLNQNIRADITVQGGTTNQQTGAAVKGGIKDGFGATLAEGFAAVHS